MSYKELLDVDDQQILDLKSRWQERGALVLSPNDESAVIEYLHHYERELALNIIVGGVRDSALLTPADRQDLLEVLLVGWPWVRAPVTPEQYAEALLTWTPESGEPFPELT